MRDRQGRLRQNLPSQGNLNWRGLRNEGCQEEVD